MSEGHRVRSGRVAGRQGRGPPPAEEAAGAAPEPQRGGGGPPRPSRRRTRALRNMSAVGQTIALLEGRMISLRPRVVEAEVECQRLAAELARVERERDQERARARRLQSDLIGALGGR